MTAPSQPDNPIPTNKFHPPRIIDSRVVPRADLLDKFFPAKEPYRCTIITGRAGQGKTTTAQQILQHLDTPFLWYQIGAEDNDPLFFFSALVEGLRDVAGFSSPGIEAMLSDNAATMADLRRLTGLLLVDLGRQEMPGFTIIFDDLHLLPKGCHTLQILAHLIEAGSNDLSFMLLSRQPVTFLSQKILFSAGTLQMDNTILAFSQAETKELLTRLLDSSPDDEYAANLLSQTNGWVMGLVLASHMIRSGHYPHGERWKNRDNVFGEYFQRELLSLFDDDLRLKLFKLSLLDEIPVSLGRAVTGEENIHADLVRLMETSGFIRSLDQEGEVYGFHHLFGEFLRTEAEQALSKQEKHTILKTAANYCFEHNLRDKGMRYLLRAEDWGGLEAIFEQYGMEIFVRHRQVTLASLLADVPPEQINSSPWFSLFLGLVIHVMEPERGLALYRRSKQLFREQGHDHGELLVTCQIILIYFAHLPDIDKGVTYLEDGDRLFQKTGDDLPVFCRIDIARNLGWAHLYFRNDIETAMRFCRISELAAQEKKNLGLLLEARVALGFSFLYAGLFANFVTIAEWLHGLMKGENISMYSRVLGYYLQLQALHINGDAENYRLLNQELRENVDEGFLKKTIIYSFLSMYEIDLAMTQGDLLLAETLVNDHLDSGHFASVNHLRMEMLGTKALILAHQGFYKQTGSEYADTALQLLEKCTVPMMRMKAMLLVGGAWTIGGELEKARTLLTRVLEGGTQFKSSLFIAHSRMHLALIAIFSEDSAMMKEHIDHGLVVMHQQGYKYVRGFTSSMFLDVLRKAVELDVQRDLARELARSCFQVAIIDDGSVIPLLRITTLGLFAMHMGDKQVALIDDFTPIQRQLLGALVTSRDGRVSKEKLLELLWPDLEPEKAQTRFDALMNRLRTTLKTLLGARISTQYLVLRKGILSLNNCLVDIWEFDKLYTLGGVHAAKGNWWMAGLSWFPALKLWQGNFVADLFGVDQADRYDNELMARLVAMAIQWSEGLITRDRPDEAKRIMEQVRQYDIGNDQLFKLLYTLYEGEKGKIQQKRLLASYSEQLQRTDYSTNEINMLLADVVT